MPLQFSFSMDHTHLCLHSSALFEYALAWTWYHYFPGREYSQNTCPCCLWSFPVLDLHIATFLLAGSLACCAPHVFWCLFLLKGSFMKGSGLSFPGALTCLLCPSAVLLKIIAHLFFSILHLLYIILILCAELVPGSHYLFYFTKTSDLPFSSSLLDCLLSSFPKVSREDFFHLFYCIKLSFPKGHICFFFPLELSN